MSRCPWCGTALNYGACDNPYCKSPVVTAPSPVTAAGEEPTAAEQLVNDYERVIMERSQISVFSTHAKARNDARHADIRSRLVAALLGAPAPTSAVPGLRDLDQAEHRIYVLEAALRWIRAIVTERPYPERALGEIEDAARRALELGS